MTYKELLSKACSLIKKYNKEEEAIKFLLLEMSGLSNTQFYLDFNKEVDSKLVDSFLSSAKEYIDNDVPIQHILGYSYFYGRKLIVTNNSFIPRNETEELVENVLLAYDEYFYPKKVDCIDLGTGSGCIAISLALEESNMNVSATDLSTNALEVAKNNALNNGANVKFLTSNWFDNVEGKYDIIVSNPPYIPNLEVLDNVVLKDPSLALFGGQDGTDFYETILKNASAHLNDYGLIAFEHGFNQAEKIGEYARKFLNDPQIKVIKDMQGKNRITLIGIGGVLK